MSPTRTGLSLVCSLLLANSLVAAPPAELKQYPSGQPVSQQQLTEAICRGWVEVRTTSPAQVVFWDILLDVDGDSRLLLGCNQDYIYALALAGRFDNGLQRLTPGMASLWPHFGGNSESPAIHDFAAGALVKLFTEGGQPTDAGLEVLARDQRSLAGTVEAGEQMLALAPAEAPFRVFPEVMAIKRASRHPGDYGLRTATQFAQALAQRDTGLLAALLAPSLFEEETSASTPAIKPSPDRIAFAERLLAHNNYSEVAGSPGLRDLGDLRYELRSPRQVFRITLQEAEGCLYVRRLDPES